MFALIPYTTIDDHFTRQSKSSYRRFVPNPVDEVAYKKVVYSLQSTVYSLQSTSSSSLVVVVRSSSSSSSSSSSTSSVSN
jgi:hypothetical protein